MGLFDHLDNLEVTAERTAPCELPELGPRAVVHLAHAGPTNKAYWDARLAPGLSRVVRKAKGGRSVDAKKLLAKSEAEIERTRNLDRQLFPKHIIRGWEGIPNTEGADVPFCVEAAQELCDKLVAKAPDLFDRLRMVAGDIDNYRELPDEGDDDDDLEEAAKN